MWNDTTIRGRRPRPNLRNRTVIVVEDGIATGGTVRATIRSLRAEEPKSLIMAVPVVAAEVARALVDETDRFVCLKAPNDLYAIGLWYEDFEQVPDEEVVRLLELRRAEQERGASAGVVSRLCLTG